MSLPIHLPHTQDWRPVATTRSLVGSYDWGDKMLRVPDIHSRGVLGKLKAGIIDTGKSRHLDLKYADAYCVIPGDDGYDRAGHGSHVASIIRRAAPKCELFSVKALSDQGDGDTAGIARAIRWCADQGCKVINLSLGGGNDRAMLVAIDYAWSKGCIVLCASGNSGGHVEWPARYAGGIGSSKATGDISDFSCRGNEIRGAAPGEHILGCDVETGYVRMSGTSMATPLYVAMVLLMLDAQEQAIAAGRRVIDRVVDQESLNRHIERHSTDQGVKGRDVSFGWGIPTISFVFDGIEDATGPPADGPALEWGGIKIYVPARAGDLASVAI